MNIVSCDPEEKGENGENGRRGPVGIPDIVDQVGSSLLRGFDGTTVSPPLRLCVVSFAAGNIAPIGCAAGVPARGCPMSEKAHD